MKNTLGLLATLLLCAGSACGGDSSSTETVVEPGGGGGEDPMTEPQSNPMSEPPNPDIVRCESDADCGEAERCDECASASCDVCDDCVAGCIPAD